MIKRTNNACSYFPCHEDLEDCTFCYCPFYPCLDKKLGKSVSSLRFKEEVWSCQDCNWMHQAAVVDEIFSFIRKNKQSIKDKSGYAGLGVQELKLKGAGILVLGHGSRFPRADLIMREIVDTLKQRLNSKFILSASMQFSHPDISVGIKRLVRKNCKRIIIVPLFLFGGNHVMRDIPRMLEEEKAKYPEVKFIYARNLGADTRITDIIMERIEEAVNEIGNQ